MLVAEPAAAQTIKKWVDEEGVTHYSDKPPENGATPVDDVQVQDSAPADADSQTTTERLKKQAEILEQDRKQRELEAERKRKAERERAGAQEEIFVPKQRKDDDGYRRHRYPYYPGPHRPVRPGKPIRRPVPRPGIRK